MSTTQGLVAFTSILNEVMNAAAVASTEAAKGSPVERAQRALGSRYAHVLAEGIRRECRRKFIDERIETLAMLSAGLDPYADRALLAQVVADALQFTVDTAFPPQLRETLPAPAGE